MDFQFNVLDMDKAFKSIDQNLIDEAPLYVYLVQINANGTDDFQTLGICSALNKAKNEVLLMVGRVSHEIYSEGDIWKCEIKHFTFTVTKFELDKLRDLN